MEFMSKLENDISIANIAKVATIAKSLINKIKIWQQV
jgi:hypothetical protein